MAQHTTPDHRTLDLVQFTLELMDEMEAAEARVAARALRELQEIEKAQARHEAALSEKITPEMRARIDARRNDRLGRGRTQRDRLVIR